LATVKFTRRLVPSAIIQIAEIRGTLTFLEGIGRGMEDPYFKRRYKREGKRITTR
jgi:hypothetical protein